MKIVRCGGGLVEVVILPGGGSVTSQRDEAFEVLDVVGAALVKDGTGRFHEVQQALAAADVEAPEEPGAAGEP